MKNKIKEVFAVSKKGKINQDKLKKEIEDIFNEFKRAGIDFCLLRNYSELEKQKDLDILIKNKKGLRRIMQKFNLRKRTSYGPYLSYKREDLWLDFKVGCLAYNGFCFESAESILSRKRPNKSFYLLKEEDEFIHLILHPVLFKGFFKEKYKSRIRILSKNIDEKKVVENIERKFPGYGKILIDLAKAEEYDKLLSLRKILFWKLFNLRGLPFFCIMRGVSKYGGAYKKIFK